MRTRFERCFHQGRECRGRPSETQLPRSSDPPHAQSGHRGRIESPLEQQLAQAREAFEAAQHIEDVSERRRQAAHPQRDVRYSSEEGANGPRSDPASRVDRYGLAFGNTVTFERNDGRVQTYRIVGEDEADPKAGSISFVSPVARSLTGKHVGDVVASAGQELEVVAIA